MCGDVPTTLHSLLLVSFRMLSYRHTKLYLLHTFGSTATNKPGHTTRRNGGLASW